LVPCLWPPGKGALGGFGGRLLAAVEDDVSRLGCRLRTNFGRTTGKNSQQGTLVLGDRPRRLTGTQKWSIALSPIGAVICLPAAAFFGFALGYYPSKMECTPEAMGSGCYEGDLLYASLFVVFLPRSL
jgi:hypothetical protein